MANNKTSTQQLRHQKEQNESDMDGNIAKIRHQERTIVKKNTGLEVSGTAFMLVRHGGPSGPLSVQEIEIEKGEVVSMKQLLPPETPLITFSLLERDLKVRLFRQTV